MKNFKTLCTAVVLTALFVGAVPQSGLCSMSRKPVISCSMACCKSTAKTAPACPFVKPATPQYKIGLSSLSVAPSVQVVAVLALRDFLAPYNAAATIYPDIRSAKPFLSSSPQTGRAPPHLA
jgi:hypothetical protein